MTSIRLHLLGWISLGALLLIVLAFILTAWVTGDAVRRNFDQGLIDKAVGIASLVERDVLGVEFDFPHGMMLEFSRAAEPEYFHVRGSDGSEIGRSRSLSGQSWSAPMNLPDDESIQDETLPDGRPGRGVLIRRRLAPSRQVIPKEELAKFEAARATLGLPEITHVLVHYARDRAPLQRFYGEVRWIFILLGTAMVLCFVFIVSWALRSGLRPLNSAARTLESLALDGRAEEWRLHGLPRELGFLKSEFERFVDRVRESLRRERDFTSHVAHELRTPVAELRLVTDMAVRWSDDPDVQIESAKQSQEIAFQLERIVQTCLRVARLEQGKVKPTTEKVDVCALLRTTARQLSAALPQRHMEVLWSTPEICVVETDPEMLGLVLSNLMDNAFSHAPKGAAVSVMAGEREAETEILICNPLECQEPKGNEGQVLRDVQAASDCERHLGLGITIAQSAVTLMGGALRFRDSGGRFEARLSIPRSISRGVGLATG